MGNHSSLPRFRVMASSWPADTLGIAHIPLASPLIAKVHL